MLAHVARTYWDPLQMPLARLVLDAGVMVSVYSSLMIFVMGKDFYLDLFRAMRNAPSASAESEAPAGADCYRLLVGRVPYPPTHSRAVTTPCGAE